MIDRETCSTFIHIYNDIIHENKFINIYELSFHILMTFLNNLSNKQKEFLSQNLPIKFFKLRQKMLQSKLRSILVTNQLKYKMQLIKYLYIWKNLKKSKVNKSNNSHNKFNSFIYNRNSSLQNANTCRHL